MKKLFEGVGIAIVTPFLNNQTDYVSLEKLVHKGIKEGASAIIVLGTTGEGSTISAQEREKIVGFCRKIIPPTVKMIVGTGNNNFETCLKNTQMAKDLGADGVLVVTPYYNKTTQRGLIQYYQDLAQIKIPIIMYNVPSRTGLNIEVDTVKKIIETNNQVYGIKEATCDINRIMLLHEVCKEKIAVYSGEDDLNYLFYCLGSMGTISVTANAYCKEVDEIYKCVKQQNLKKAFAQHEKLSPVNKVLFCETNPVPIKYALKTLDIIESEEVRRPLIELCEENKEKIEDYLKKYNENIFK